MDGFGVAAKAYGYQTISLSMFSPRVQCRAPFPRRERLSRHGSPRLSLTWIRKSDLSERDRAAAAHLRWRRNRRRAQPAMSADKRMSRTSASMTARTNPITAARSARRTYRRQKARALSANQNAAIGFRVSQGRRQRSAQWPVATEKARRRRCRLSQRRAAAAHRARVARMGGFSSYPL